MPAKRFPAGWLQRVSSSPFFRDDGRQPDDADPVILPRLSEDDWRRLLAFTARRSPAAGELVIRAGEQARALYFIGGGTFDIVLACGARGSAPTLARAGSVIGDVTFRAAWRGFFSANGRSAVSDRGRPDADERLNAVGPGV